MKKKLTVPEIRAVKGSGRRLSLVTCYDYSTAKILDESDTDIILVGDSLGMTMMGYDGTVGVTLDDCIHHGKSVKRAVKNTFILGDMPFGTYNVSPEQAVINANRMFIEMGCDAIKLEGGKRSAAAVKAMVDAGIPVSGHIGLTPQTASMMGGFKVQGKSMDAVNALLEDAKAIEEAGAFMIMIEGLPLSVGKYINENIGIPTIGIGAGPCDIQGLILQDMLGYTDWVPKFAKKYADLHSILLDAFNTYHKEVVEGTFPTPEYSYNTKVEGLDD